VAVDPMAGATAKSSNPPGGATSKDWIPRGGGGGHTLGFDPAGRAHTVE
jgi:hypothetical protein